MHNHRLARTKEATSHHRPPPSFPSGSARNTAVGVAVDALLASVLGLGKKLCPVQSGKRGSPKEVGEQK